MQRLLTIFAVMAALIILVLAGCSDRGSNIPTRTDTFGWTWLPQETPPFAPWLTYQRANPDGQIRMTVWAPESVVRDNAPASLLILLAPGEEDQWFYFEHGLHKICNEMIANGEMDPMVIACVANDRLYGGYFYGNSIPGGLYDYVLGDELIQTLRFRYPSLITDANHQAIGGVGQGAYGAFRAAIQNPGTFTSITAIDGPLDFDGANGNSGFMTLFNDALYENGLNLTTGYSRLDTARQIDSSSANPITRMFIGGSVAFSPHDTGLTISGARHFGNLEIIEREQLADSTTLITHLLTGQRLGGPFPKTAALEFSFHLPFDSISKTHAPTWRRWLANNLDTLLVKQGGTALDNTSIWIASTPEARYSFHEQTVSFERFLTEDMDLAIDTVSYEGYPGNPAHDNEYLFHLLRQMIQYHAAHFRADM
ncbi:MAG: hypothetical protein IPH75_07125 [bacterium]|nr:hypothetical protein [bacterium]